jgi:V/A-type H+-transporting ATPase subunit C
MAGVIQYSGIVTKVHAMNRRLLNAEDYEELIQKTSVLEALEFLKNTPAYAEAFSDAYAKNSHRDAIERRLMDSLYTDFIKLYRFSGIKERTFLNSYFLHYEVMIVKICLRNTMNLNSWDVSLGNFDEFFHRHSKLSIADLNHSDTLEEYMAALAGSPYEKLFAPIYNSGSRRLSDYETALDLYYFSSVWKLKKKKLSDKEEQEVTAAWGTNIDLLNLQWIYRCRRHFSMADTDILPMLIPINYKLRPPQIQRLIHAETDEEFAQILSETVYSKWFPTEDLSRFSAVSDQLLGHIYQLKCRENPYSIASVNRYLYRKEEEINHLIPIIEGIRYGLSPEQIREFVPSAL